MLLDIPGQTRGGRASRGAVRVWRGLAVLYGRPNGPEHRDRAGLNEAEPDPWAPMSTAGEAMRGEISTKDGAENAFEATHRHDDLPE